MRTFKTMAAKDFVLYAQAFKDADHWLPEMTDEVLASVVEVVEAWIDDEVEWAETDSRITVRLDDGRYGVFTEWSDETGHG